MSDPRSFEEFLVYFPHDGQVIVVSKENMIIEDQAITNEGAIVFQCIYECKVYRCILIQVR